MNIPPHDPGKIHDGLANGRRAIKSNAANLETLTSAVTAHCLCFKLTEDSVAGRYLVVLPDGYQVDAVRAQYSGAAGCGKAAAMSRLLAKLEQIWKESFWQ